VTRLASAMLVLSVGLATVGVLSTASAKPPTTAQARALAEFANGEALFADAAYDAAATRFKAAHDHHADPVYLFNIATCYDRLQRWALAVQYYDRFLADAPESPAAGQVKALRAAAASAREAERVTVQLSSDPSGAEAAVTGPGGESNCETPCRVRTSPGVITVAFSRAGASRTLSKVLKPGETWQTSVDLQPMQAEAHGMLNVVVNVQGATIRVNGQINPAGVDLALPPGAHDVMVTHTEYRVWESPVQVVQGKTTAVHVDLSSQQATGGPGAQKIAGWATLGVGGAVLVNGIVFAALASKSFSDGQGLEPMSENAVRLSDLQSQVRTRSLVADISFGIAGAAITTGLILWLTGDDE
jgi:hypothetical protein